jgi:universal stress protein E
MSASVTEIACTHALQPSRVPLARILVVVDPAAAVHPCIEKAARIALHTGAELELYTCDTEQDGPRVALGREARIELHHESLERMAQPLRAQGLAVRVRSEWSAPLERGVGYHVIRTRPDLVVKDTHLHTLARAPVTMTDWILMRQLPTPLLLVKPEPWPERMHITLSCDPCHPAARTPEIDSAMLAIGCTLGEALRADLDVLHVLESPPHLPGEPVPPQARHAHHAAARALVGQLIADGNFLGVRIPACFEEGRVAEKIIQFASQHRPQIMIMGAAPRARWVYAAAGGTAAQVLEAIPCDMLVIKPPGFVSPLLVTEE